MLGKLPARRPQDKPHGVLARAGNAGAQAFRCRTADAWFPCGVATTGIYCRTGCPGPLPQHRNAVFGDTATIAEQAGLPHLRRLLSIAEHEIVGRQAQPLDRHQAGSLR
ncbi:MAG: hypothetical protein GDA47_00770 [Rhodospirillales bacterium]|nr:hypothetical protein [Rhodospirillales bacterium]